MKKMASTKQKSKISISMCQEDFKFNDKLSLYIPVIDEKINQAFITSIFENLKIGEISRIDFVYSLVGKKQAFIHFNKWYDNASVHALQKKIMSPSANARVIYDKPKFWPILPNRMPLDVPHTENTNIVSILQNKIIELEFKLNAVSVNNTSTAICDDDFFSYGKRRRTFSDDTSTMNILEEVHLETPVINRSISIFDRDPPPIRRFSGCSSDDIFNRYL